MTADRADVSADQVSTAHIDVLINAALAQRRETGMRRLRWNHSGKRHTINEANAARAGTMLTRMNRAAAGFRYRHEHGIEDDGPDYPEPYQFHGNRGWVVAVYNPVVVLKAIACYEQLCAEYPGWHGSEAQSFCDELRLHVIEWLPGYQAAPWGITDLRQAWETSGDPLAYASQAQRDEAAQR
jgi:hypothetical protein